jgi:hypothetical protein
MKAHYTPPQMLQTHRLTWALLFLCGVTTAQESRWRHVGATDSVDVYLDTKSPTRDENAVKAWSMWVYRTPLQLNDSVPPQMYRSTKQHVVYDCASRTSSMLEILFYEDVQASGDVVGSASQSRFPGLYGNVIPNSIGEKLLDFACKMAPRAGK